jgi:hypothetical protein
LIEEGRLIEEDRLIEEGLKMLNFALIGAGRAGFSATWTGPNFVAKATAAQLITLAKQGIH